MIMKLSEVQNIQQEQVVTSLAENVTLAVQNYLNELKEDEVVNLFQLVMDEIEAPLLKYILQHCRYNQSRAATMLGLSRGTLRTKLRRHFDNQYTESRH